MTAHERPDPLFGILARLPAAGSDPTRARRTRDRCVQLIERRRRPAAIHDRAFRTRRLEFTVVSGFALLYLAAMFGHLARWYSVF